MSVIRTFAGLTTFGLIAGGIWLTGLSVPLLYVTLALCVAFVTACYLAPSAMTRLISMPHAFQVGQNLGRAGLELQSVTYAAYHTHWYARMTHHGWLLDGLAWTVLGWLAFGPWVVVALVAWAAWQGRSFGEPLFTAALVTLWITTGLAAFAVLTLAGPELALASSACSLLAGAVWRVTGHVVEPVPPGIVDNDRFARLADVPLQPRIIRAALLGLIAEFAAGLPYRLGVFWVYRRLLGLGWQPTHQIDGATIAAQSDAAHLGGWAAAPATRSVA